MEKFEAICTISFKILKSKISVRGHYFVLHFTSHTSFAACVSDMVFKCDKNIAYFPKKTLLINSFSLLVSVSLHSLCG